MPLISFAALLFLGHLLAAVLAQGSSCSRELLGQGCDLAESYRRSPRCPRGNPTGAQRPLNDPPTSEYANNCMCTTSYYSLVSACELCKGSRAVTWHVWKQNCRDFAINGPDNYGLDYPSWAQLSYGDQETFNVERLRQEGRLNEPQQPQPQPQPQPAPTTTTQPPANPTTRTTRNGSPSQTTTSAPTVAPTASTNSDSSSSSSVESSALSDSQSISGEDASTSLSGSGSRSTPSTIIQQELRSSANPNNPNVPNPSDDPFGLGPAGTRGAGNNDPNLDNATGASGNSLNVGAIVGGVVGGLFLVLFIAAGLYFFVLRRRRNRIPASAAYMAQFGDSRVTSFRSQPLHSSSNSIENARPESPTLPRSSVDLYNPYYDSSPVASTHPYPAEDPFNPPPHSSPPENYADMRETNNMSRQSSRRYTRTPTPLVGPRPR